MSILANINRLLDRFSAKLFIIDVAVDQQTLSAVLLDQVLGLFRVFVFSSINHSDVRAFFCKGNGDGAADPLSPQ